MQCNFSILKLTVVDMIVSIFNMFQRQVQSACAQMAAAIPVRKRHKRK